MENILEISNLSKKYRSEYALRNISLSVKRGEILGLVGANGSGKSTLMNILAGNPVIADTGGFTGEIKFEGNQISPATPAASLRIGIGMVYQEFALIPSLSAAENIMLGRENMLSFHEVKLPFIDKKRDMDEAALLLSNLGVTDVSPSVEVSNFSVGVRQFIEFARVINSDALKLLILDEPTAVLGLDESAKLMREVKRLADSGTSVIFISHRIDEVRSLCSRIAVLRDGELAGIFNTPESRNEEIVYAMLGTIHNRARKTHNSSISDAPFFEIEGLSCTSVGERLSGFSIKAGRGEIIGITGQSGQGQMLIGKAVMGLISSEGVIRINGALIKPGDIKGLFNSGFCYIPEERRRDGILPEHSVADNIAFTLISARREFTSVTGVLKYSRIKKSALSYISRLKIKCRGPRQRVCELSGGNQQKVILARALSLSPEVMMVFEPTRGIDIGAKEMILDMLLGMNRDNRTTIIIVSSELDELMRVCDRIAVLYEGKIFSILTPDLPAGDFTLAFSGRHSG